MFLEKEIKMKLKRKNWLEKRLLNNLNWIEKIKKKNLYNINKVQY